VWLAATMVTVWVGIVSRDIAAWSRAYASADDVRSGRLAPDYELQRLAWSVADARSAAVIDSQMQLLTGAGPYRYQATATVATNRATVAHVAFRVRVATGGITVGLVGSGGWLALQTVSAPGVFEHLITAPITGEKSITVVIANANPAGESAATIEELRMYFVR
jgi:hypothetical protein